MKIIFRLIVILAVVGLLGIDPRVCHADQAPSLNSILDAWKRREATVRSIVVNWSERTTMTSVAINDSAPESVAADDQVGFGPFSSLAAFSGAMYRFETVIARDSLLDSRDNSGTEPMISTFDGERNYSVQPENRMGVPIGETGKETSFKQALSIQLRPVMLAFRPITSGVVDAGRGSFEVDPQTVDMSGMQCVRLRHRRRDFPQEMINVLYLDVERDFIPLRFEEYYRSVLRASAEIVYTQSQSSGVFLPVEWRAQFFASDGQVMSAHHATDVNCEINKPLSREYFQIKFEPGSRIADRTKDGRLFVVEDDGSLRPWLPGQSGGIPIPWFWMVVTAVVLTIGSMLAFRILRARG